MKTVLIVAFAALSFACSEPNHSPYAGQDARAIKSLSADEISGYLSGAGMGFAKVAELNGYPGPKHVLEMAEDLQLTSGQKGEVLATFQRMNSDATDLGEQLIEVERSLDALFATGSPDSAVTRSAIMRSADLRGRIRMTHVMAHFEMMRVLTPH